MARRHRDTTPGIFHVFTHSVWAADALYRDDDDRMRFLRELVRATRKTKWRCIAYCLMRTHYHLLLDVDADVLPLGMHSLNFRYAAGFNARHRMKGHVHGTRYNAHRVEGDQTSYPVSSTSCGIRWKQVYAIARKIGPGAATPRRSGFGQVSRS